MRCVWDDRRIIKDPARNDNIIEEICDDIDGLAVHGVDETQGVTTFANEAAICTEVPYESPSSFFTSTVPQYQDLKEYFSRPRLIVSGTAANTRGNRWGVAVTPKLMFAENDVNSWFPDGAGRLQGVAGVRFNLKFTLTVAANPFHQGVLALAFQYGKTSGVDVWNRSRAMSSVTQLPHVRLDFAETTMVTFDVPFLYQYDYFPLDDKALNAAPALGYVSVNQLMQTPILTNSGAPTWKLFVSLHDLELIGSKPRIRTTVVPQSGLSRSAKAVVKGANTIMKEAKGTGAISGFANAGADAVSALTTAVPSLALIGGPTTWFLRLAGKVASAFGYSKPTIEQPPVKHYRIDNANDLNVDVPNPANVVGPFQSNKLRVDSTFPGTDEDEMSMAYVLSKYGQIFLGSMATTDTTGTTLYAANNSPSFFWFRTTTSKPGGNLPMFNVGNNSYNAFQPTPLCYFGTMFRMWRGGMKFRITFAKTKFHAGRLMLAFVPSPKAGADGTGYSPDSTADLPEQYLVTGGTMPQPFGYTMMLDLRDQSVFEFEVPYLSPQLYTSVFGSTGSVSLTVVDPLIANGEAATSIDYLIEVCAMPDFEFAVAAPPLLTPVPNQATNISFPTAQSGLAVANKRETCEYTVGEKFTSLKQLAMMPSYYAFDVPTASVTTSTIPFWWYFPRWVMGLGMANPTTAWLAQHRGGLIAACYAFVHGSTNVHMYTDGGTVGSAFSLSVIADPTDGAADQNTPNSAIPNRFKSYAERVLHFSTERATHVVLPQHSSVARICYDDVYDSSAAFRNFVPGARNLAYATNALAAFANPIVSAYNAVIRNTSGQPIRISTGIAAGDDARAGCYIGVPPVALFNSAQTVSNELSLPV